MSILTGQTSSTRRTARRRTAATAAARPRELRREDRADRPGVDRLVGVPAGARVDRADVEARRAADAAQRLAARPRRPAPRERPLSSSTRWNSCGPSPGVTPVQSDVYGFIRSPVAERGRSCRKTSRSRSVGHDLLDAHDRDEHLAAASAHAPVALGLHHADSARSRRRRSSRREIATCAARKCSRRWRRAASASAAGSSDRSGGRRSCPANSSRISARFLWMAGTRMCDERSPGELDDQLGQVGLDRVDARASQRVVQADLVGRIDLTLTTSRAPWRGARCRRRSRSPRPRRAPSAPSPPARLHRRLELLEVGSGSWRSVRALIAAPASRSASQSRQLGDHGPRRGADRRRGLGAGCARSCGVRSASRAAAGKGRRSGPHARASRPGSRPGAPCARRPAAGAARRRCASGTICRPRCRPRRRVEARARILSASIAIEVSAFLTANVPPKPQHSSRARQLDQVDPAHRAQQPQRPSPTCSAAASGRSGGRRRGAGSTRRRLRRRAVDQELRQLEHPRGQRRRAPPRARSPALLGQAARSLAHHADARAEGHDHLACRRDAHEAPHQRHALGLVAGVDVHLAAAGLLGGKSTV